MTAPHFDKFKRKRTVREWYLRQIRNGMCTSCATAPAAELIEIIGRFKFIKKLTKCDYHAFTQRRRRWNGVKYTKQDYKNALRPGGARIFKFTSKREGTRKEV